MHKIRNAWTSRSGERRIYLLCYIALWALWIYAFIKLPDNWTTTGTWLAGWFIVIGLDTWARIRERRNRISKIRRQ
jgi:hypothetical protein